MEENKDYQVYRFDYLTEGSQLKLEHNVYCEDVDISSLITQGADALEALRQDSMDGEQKAFEIVQAAAKQWEQQAAVTQKLNRALEYLRTPEVVHTTNQWQPNRNNSDWEEISNKVYKMSCRIREDTSYDRIKKVMVPTAWYVTWDLYLNSPKDGHNIHLAGQNQKRYTDKAAHALQLPYGFTLHRSAAYGAYRQKCCPAEVIGSQVLNSLLSILLCFSNNILIRISKSSFNSQLLPFSYPVSYTHLTLPTNREV